MHDIEVIRRDPAAFDAAMARRGLPPVSDRILAADTRFRTATLQSEGLRAQLNQITEQFPAAINSAMRQELRERSGTLREQLNHLLDDLAASEALREELLEVLPNILAADVPEGADASHNRVLHETSAALPWPYEGYVAKEHDALGAALGGMDFKTAATVSGSRFVYLSGKLARLERALGQWMLDLHVDAHGCREVAPPLLVNATTVYGTGHLPKFEDDLFRAGSDLFLIPTAEVPLTAWARQTILPRGTVLPIRMAALTPCFRSEAGAAGRDTRGMMRQHQFQKVELVSLATPEDSAEEHEWMTSCAERVLTKLGLLWRRVLLCAGDTGFTAAKTYDLEVWLPGQQAWREISSCSNCHDFQARRMGASYRPAQGKPRHLHTLNGSGVAVGRALIAVLETHQRPDGSVMLPPVLHPYMGGLTIIEPE